MFNFSEMTPEDKQTLIEHLEDFRKALLVSVVAIIVCAFPAFYYSDVLITFIQLPLVKTHTHLSFTTLFAPFYARLSLSLIAGLIVSFPVVVWQVWKFVAPALYPGEKKTILWVFPIVLILFVGGVAFGYMVILPAALYFLVVTMGQGLSAVLTIDDYVSKLIAFTLPFGFLFELPVVVYLLTKLGMVTPAWLSERRKYALLIIFIIAAFLTPGPDPVSQCLLGVPIYLLYEISILVSKMVKPSKKPETERVAAEESESASSAEEA